MRCTVIGIGYLGATHAACMAELGHEVLGVDIDPNKITALQTGITPFYEPGLARLVTRNLRNGRLDFTTDYQKASRFADVHFLTVGTPATPGSGRADLAALHRAVDQLVPLLKQPTVIIGKSTVPAGTSTLLTNRIRTSAPEVDIEVAWSPEFLREGQAVTDTMHPDRIVVGIETSRRNGSAAEKVMREIYAPLLSEGVPFIVTDPTTAELTKTAANAFVATKVSYINAMADMCEATGADVTTLATAVGYDHRIGPAGLEAGIGFGGGCLPKDIRALIAHADDLGIGSSLGFLREIDVLNRQRRTGMVDLALRACNGLPATIAILGVAFKPGSDDVRDSPALDIAETLRTRGARVTVYDPFAIDNARHLHTRLAYAASTEEACRNADVILVLTDWPEFIGIDPDSLNTVVRSRRIIDGRNCLDARRWQSHGWTYRGIGRNVQPEQFSV